MTPRERDDFIERLAGFRREERDAAAHTLQSRGYDPAQFLIAELHAAPSIAQWRFSLGRATANLLTYGGELAVYLLLEVVIAALTNGNGGGGWWFFGTSSNSERSEAPVYSEETRHRKRIGKIVRGLASCEDLRVIGPLLERMHEADEDAKWRAMLAVKDLLPRLRPSDSELLNPAQKMRLYQVLQDHDAQTCIAALQAIANIGDSRALPPVEGLIHSPNVDIRRAAAFALPALQERARRERESQTLLRGSAAPVMGGDILLRPAPPAPPANPAEMLRASQQGTGNREQRTEN